MTEQHRIGREALLKRAVALAGAGYITPVFTFSVAKAASNSARCDPEQSCTPDPEGDVACKAVGGPACRCGRGLGGAPIGKCGATLTT